MLALEGLSKRFDTVTAVDGLSLRVEAGDAFGFIGPNGAGKTTTIRMIASLLPPTEGEIWIDGISVRQRPNEVPRLVGYMPDFFGAYDDLTTWEYLDFFASAFDTPKPTRSKLIDDMLELTDLGGKRDALVEHLSRGMKQRLCLARVLLHDPRLLLLDEPASGLDPRARVEMRELLKELRAMGKTIFVSSHILPELADFCNKVAIIERGKLVLAGTVEEILQQVKPSRRLTLGILCNEEAAAGIAAAFPGVRNVRSEPCRISLDFDGQREAISDLLLTLVQAGVKVVSLTEDAVDLEDVFMKVTEGAVG